MKRLIKKSDLIENPYLKWNEFIDFIACENYEDMNEVQRKAHLVFNFEQEMQNGGIVQYFTNRKTEKIDELIEALEFMKASKQVEVLREVLALSSTLDLGKFKNMHDFINKVFVDSDFTIENCKVEEKFDQAISNAENLFYNSKPSIVDCLEKYLEDYEEDFIKVI